MNHCHKRMEFIKRNGKYRLFKCVVCGMGSIIFDNGHRYDGHIRAEKGKEGA